jgi:hypothetical protein
MEVAGLECARRALAEARARAAYRSDTFAHLFSECKLALASLMKPDRDGARKPERDKAIVETMWGVLAMANVIVRNSLFYNQPLTKLDPAGVSDQVRLLRGTPPDLVKSILDVVNADVLQSVYDKARGAAERCRMLPWHAESEALVPFTDECMPQPLRAHQCWCGYWVEVGLWQCPFCGEPTRPPAPNVRPTLLWRRGNCVVLRMSELSPTTLASLKAEEPEEAWEALPGATDPSENLAEDQTGELTGEETNAEKHD